MVKYKSIDLFAGIGGIRLGFDRAFGDEINTVFVSEWDEHAQKTYKANFKDDFDIAGDITKIDEKRFRNSIFVLRVFLVRRLVLREKDKVLMIITKDFAEELYLWMLQEFVNIINRK